MSEVQLQDDPQESETDLELLRVARIGRAQGLKGEVSVQVFTDEPEERFAPGSELFDKEGTTTYEVEDSRTFKGRWYIKLAGVNTREDAEALRNTELYGEAWELDEDEFYPKDLIGLEVRMAAGNGVGLPADYNMGKVVDMIEGSQWLVKVRLSQQIRDKITDDLVSANTTENKDDGEFEPPKTALVPFVKQLVPEVDLEQGYLTIDPPGGLIEGL